MQPGNRLCGAALSGRTALAVRRRLEMADRRGLGVIGWILGAVTATVVAISSVVVTVNVLEAAPTTETLSAISR